MSSRERTIVAILVVIIAVALLGIGLLVSRLTANEEPTATASPLPPVTITAVVPPTPSLPQETPAADVGEPVAVRRAESAGPGAPAIIEMQALHPGRRYRIEITAADGTNVAVNGSWSQAVAATQGQPAAPEIVFFEAMTPHQIAVVSPVENPQMWSVSVSAGPADILGAPPALVITIWDVTEGE